MSTRFSLGIDLGTTNSAMALTGLESDHTEVIEVTQIIGANQIGEKPTLPSALYIPHRDEFPKNSFLLPWDNEIGDTTIAGHFAREHDALIPIVSSLLPNRGSPTRISTPGINRFRGDRTFRRRSSRLLSARGDISRI